MSQGPSCGGNESGDAIQTKPTADQITPLIQRQTEEEEEEVQPKLIDGGHIQRQSEEEEEEPIQAKPLPGKATPVNAGLQSRIQSIRGGGQPLPRSSRTFFESRFGRDFSDVRVHTDSRAADTARSVNAKAFTSGKDVVFGANQYSTDTTIGKRLMAHELTHVVQQQRIERKILQRDVKKYPCSVHVYDASNPKDTAVIPGDGSGIGVTNVADMVTKVNAHVNDPKNACSCVVRLEINGHGADGNQSVGAGLGNDSDKILDADSRKTHLQQLTNMKLCSTGLFMLLGCHVGRGRGKKLLRRLSKILPGKLIGGAKHYTAGTGLGKKKVTGAGDAPNTPMAKRDPFLTSKYVRWHLTIGNKEYVINGAKTTSTQSKAKLKKAKKIKVITPDGVVRIK